MIDGRQSKVKWQQTGKLTVISTIAPNIWGKTGTLKVRGLGFQHSVQSHFTQS